MRTKKIDLRSNKINLLDHSSKGQIQLYTKYGVRNPMLQKTTPCFRCTRTAIFSSNPKHTEPPCGNLQGSTTNDEIVREKHHVYMNLQCFIFTLGDVCREEKKEKKYITAR